MRPRLSSRRRSDCGPERGEGGRGREMQTDREIDTFQGLGLTCLEHIKEIRYNGPILFQMLRCFRYFFPVQSLNLSFILSLTCITIGVSSEVNVN